MEQLESSILIKERNAALIKEKIMHLINSGKYSDISDFKSKNKTFEDFCMRNNYKPIYRLFSTTFTNSDYLELIENLYKKEKQLKQNDSEIIKTSINGNNFIDTIEQNSNNSETLNALDDSSNRINNLNDFNYAQKYVAPQANFKRADEYNISDLSQNELKTFQAIQNVTDGENVKIYEDEKGTITNIIKDDNNNYSTVDTKDGENTINNQESLSKGTKSKQKVLSKHTNTPPNISAAFTNTLILSFIIGSFFGIVFLAIYLKIMH